MLFKQFEMKATKPKKGEAAFDLTKPIKRNPIKKYTQPQTLSHNPLHTLFDVCPVPHLLSPLPMVSLSHHHSLISLSIPTTRKKDISYYMTSISNWWAILVLRAMHRNGQSPFYL